MTEKSRNDFLEENAEDIIENYDKSQLAILSKEYVVTKSNSLMYAFDAPLSVSAFRLLDTYLSKINPRDPSSARVGFKKSDYLDLIGKKLQKPQIEKILDELRHKDMYIKNDKGDKLILNLFALTGISKDGSYIVMECNPRLNHLFFDIKQFGYFRYQLQNTLNLSTAHHMTVYNYLMANSFKRNWVVNINDLVRNHLQLKGDYYLTYHRLNAKILSPAIKEINEKTNLVVSYEPHEKSGVRGKKVDSIKFSVLVKDNMVYTQENDKDKDKEDSDNYIDDPRETKYSNEQIAQLAAACNFEFTNQEMVVLFDMFMPYCDKLPKEGLGVATDRYNYLSLKYHEMELVASKKQINNRFNYLKKLLEESLKKL